MKKFNKNPRKITTSSKNKLQASLTDLGDLSGIVHNRKTDEIVGGNQRMAIFGNNYEIVIDHQNDLPDEQGTVAIGRIVWNGNSYAYRLVDWDEETANKANLLANLHSGTWDMEILRTEWTPEELLVFDFDNIRDSFQSIAAVADGTDVTDVNLDDFFSESTEQDNEEKKLKIVLEYTAEDHALVIDAFKKKKATKEQVVWEMLGL